MAVTPDVEPVNTEPYQLRIGSYGVLHPLGTGGMSSVYRAVHLETGVEVALKVLPPFLARNSTVLKRFMGEARSAETLEHRNIVSIFDHGSDQGRHYLVLEYVRGGDFHEYVQRHGAMSPAAAIEVALQVVDGLEYAASRGLIHRDVKPSNLMRTPEGEVKIADLGLALRSDAEDERVTREGTTVGTVDYMSPEQARDSRATSFQSDIYSLGCTLHYLLTALPPYPGGDIADKLTRHVRAPAPDVRDVRPGTPQALAAVVTRMMAKHPEDRHASYEELRSELRRAARVVAGDESSIALAPLDDEPSPPRAVSLRELGAAEESAEPPIAEISLTGLAPLALEGPSSAGASAGNAVSPYHSVLERLEAVDPLDDAPLRNQGGRLGPRAAPISATAWVVRCSVTGLLAVVVIIALDLLIRGPIPTPSSPAASVVNVEPPPEAGGPANSETAPPAPTAAPDRSPSARSGDSKRTAPPVEKPWVEPVDEAPISAATPRYTPATLSRYLPSWGRSPVADRIEGPTTVVQRAPAGGESEAVRSLRQALDVTRGAVEIADEGPFSIDDFRVPGDPRILRAAPGRRAIVQVSGPILDAVRRQPGVVTLSNKSLTLDSIDLVVNVRDLSQNQRALFHCEGATLTLKNCTVTIVNRTHAPFTFLRVDDPEGRRSRVRIEGSLVRGDVASLFEFRRGPVELMAERSILASEGPIVRVAGGGGADRRVFLLGNVLGCRGPCIDLTGDGRSEPAARPLVARAFDNAFGRFEGPGTASLTSAEDRSATLAGRLDWLGDNNQFLGWRSFFAVGAEQVIRARNLSAFRSTWNASDRQSQEVFVEWRPPSTLADLTTTELVLSLPGREASIRAVAWPRPYLLAKTLLSFPTPSTPEVRSPASGGAVRELVFDADSAESKGDLGAFLQEHAKPGVHRLHVKARGNGVRRCSPVRLPDGLRLRLEVERPAEPDAPGLILTPVEDASGAALFELHGGALSLDRVRIRADDDCRLESLLRVEDGFLTLESCELVGASSSGAASGRLITFRAASTRPRSAETELFTAPADRPICLISDSVLITGGQGIRAEIARGLVGLSNCMLAARGDALVLAPTQTARNRFIADLKLDRCTVATGATAVRVAAWPGAEPGPDRPWVVSSSNSAYLDLITRESALLRADADSFAQGLIFWQQNNDALEVVGFAEATGATAPARRDVVSQWINVWGGEHVRGVTGPRPNSPFPSVRFLDRPRSFPLAAGDLILDPMHSPGRSSLNVGASPSLAARR